MIQKIDTFHIETRVESQQRADGILFCHWLHLVLHLVFQPCAQVGVPLEGVMSLIT